MIGQNMVNRLYDCQVVDPQGQKIGSVKRVWLDGRTGDPAWAEVHTGLFGLKETFVPLQRAEIHDDQVQVSVAKEQVKEAPRIDVAGDELGDADQQALYRYYGMPSPTRQQAQRGQPEQGQPRRGQDQGGPGSIQQPGSAQRSTGMTRSEERLRVDTEQVETGRVRLVKHVVTEQQQITVPVSHEEVRVERTPLTGRETGTADIGEAEQEIRLHAERPVVHKDTVAVEQVNLNTEQVTEEQTLSGKVRKERIDVENDQARHRREQPPR